MVQSCCSLNLQVRHTSQPLTPVPTPSYTRGPSHSSTVFQRRRTPSNGKMPRLWGGVFNRSPTDLKNPLLWGVTCNLVWAQLWAEQASTLIAELKQLLNSTICELEAMAQLVRWSTSWCAIFHSTVWNYKGGTIKQNQLTVAIITQL